MGKKILLADDSITIQKVIELTFSDEDFEVVTVGNGRLAIEKVQEVRPDVVLCDIIMPEKDGYEVCDFIKKNPSLAHVPVLLLTGAFEPFDQERAARVGADGFLAKPFEPQTLIAKVKELLSRTVVVPAASARPAPAAVPPPAPSAPTAAAAKVPAPPASAEPEPMAFISDEPEVAAMPAEDAVTEVAEAEVFEEAAVDEPLPMDQEFYVADGTPAPASPRPAPTGREDAATVQFEAVPDAAPWAQPTIEVSLEDRASASVTAMEAQAAPAFDEVFGEEPTVPAAISAPPTPPPPAVEPAAAHPPAPRVMAEPPAPAHVAAPAAEASFADVAPETPRKTEAPASGAAEIAVPVDMVSQIAQRVVAQISEKVIREIAWEVIPDLAEALIKKEIERLKAEMQQS